MVVEIRVNELPPNAGFVYACKLGLLLLGRSECLVVSYITQKTDHLGLHRYSLVVRSSFI